MTRTTDETAPLLGNGTADHAENTRTDEPASTTGRESSRWKAFASPELRLLFAGFIISTSLCVTQVPIMYAFRKMECEEFYTHAPAFKGPGDRCARPEVDSGVAVQVMILGLTSIVCGVCNLLITGMQLRRWGPRVALMINTFFPVPRVSMQVVAVMIGARKGIILMQASQTLGIIGGPAGYLLVLNTAIAEVVDPAQRTAAFGKLQGAALMGTALGFLAGGLIGDIYTIQMPFQAAAVLLTLCFVYCTLCVPYIDPKTLGGGDKKGAGSKGKKKSFLTVLGPQHLRLRDGRSLTLWSLPLLTLGAFVAGLAVGYAPILAQMYSLTVLHFDPALNSAYMFVTMSVRGLFLMLAFPRIIAWGRKWYSSGNGAEQPDPVLVETIPTEPTDLDPAGALPAQEPVNPPKPVDEDAGAAFDLWFLRWSMVGDALITGCIGFASQPWHIFLAGFLLPLFSGSDAASKGVLTEIVSPSDRPDALQAMSLVQYTAALATVGLFGTLFSVFAGIGKAYVTFFCTAIVAVIAIVIMLFIRLPPKGSTIEVDDDADEEPISDESG